MLRSSTRSLCNRAATPLQFFIKGVIYSPSPIGSHPAWTWPHGDYFIPQYENLWARDFPLLQALGANTIRIANWNNELDHGYFLDRAHAAGLKVIVTFNMGNVWQSPVHEDWQLQQHLGAFTWQFQRYLNHPALLGWTFGEQLNLPANGFLQAFNDKHQCGWWEADVNSNPGGCFNNPDPKHACAGPIACVYNSFFGFINLAAAYAKNVMRARMERDEGQAHLVIGALSDVDVAWLRMAQFDYAAPDVDAWGLQIYRGKDFGTGQEDFLANYEHATKKYNARGEKIEQVKPLIVVEYGIDAYNDPCGKGYDSPCYNDVLETPHGGFGEDEDSQAEWGISLASILTEHSSAHGRGAVAGGTINSWIDEAWKCSQGVGGCYGPVPYPLPGFDASQCSWKAHVSCPQRNLWRPSLCGYWTPATFDHYSNQGWYGLLKPIPQWGDVDRLRPRLLYGKLQEHWGSLRASGRVRGNLPWLFLLAVSLAVGTLLTMHFQQQFRRRSAQVAELEATKSGLMGYGGVAATSVERSPLLGGARGTDRRSSRSIPAGRSSRAAGGAGVSSRSPGGGGSTSASPLLQHSGGSPQLSSGAASPQTQATR